MLYDVAVLVPETPTGELVATLQDCFDYANPVIGRSLDGRVDACELYLTFDADGFAEAMAIVLDGLDGITGMESITIDLVVAGRHRLHLLGK